MNCKAMGNIFRCPNKTNEENVKEVRKVHVGKPNSSRYPANLIVTSKYTLWNFLPKNLFEQFRRIANFYFLTITLISFIVDNPIGYVTTLLPLMFVVFVTALKQGYEDYLRHQSDRELNNAMVLVLKNHCLHKIPSKKIRVGDIIKVQENEDIPCDIVLLTSSHANSKCYVTTSSLDGETNYKTLYCPRSLKRNIKAENLSSLDATIECENPTADLYKFNGRIEFSKMTSEMLKRNSIQRQTNLNLDRKTFLEGSGRICNRRPSGADRNWMKLVADDSCSGSNGVDAPVTGKNFPMRDSTETVFCGEKGQRLRSTVQNLPGFCGDAPPWEDQPQSATDSWNGGLLLTTFKHGPKKNLTLPKSSFAKHKKSFSNVTNLSLDPAFLESLGLKTTFKRRDSNREMLIDPLTAENLVLKGSTLRNTEFIYGCSVYTGQETKMALNSKLNRTKYSVAEKSINKFLIFQLGLLIVDSTVSTILKSTIEVKSGSLKFKSIFVSEPEPQEPNASLSSVLQDLLVFFLLYNYLLPISLYVTLEMTKFFGALLFKWDMRMYDETSDQPALSNTSDLNEELGEVEYLFTDKTGTLTENNLKFHSCSIDGVTYREMDGELFRMESDGTLADDPAPSSFTESPTEMQLFLLALTLCNTVQVIVSSEGEPFRYTSTSPDEKALVEAMQRMNIVFANDEEFVVIEIDGQSRIFQKVEILEFTSRRKRMSVVVKDEEGGILLYCKGAESAVLPKAVAGRADDILRDVSNFGKKGLRTLVVGYKPLTEEEFHSIEEKIQKARETLSSDREEILHKTYEAIECDLILLGATGVEDQLQDGVQDTLYSLRAAGIKVWMLTGDKEETAVQISLTCGIFKSDMENITLTDVVSKTNCEEELQRYLSRLDDNESREFGLVVSGSSLDHVLNECPELFISLCMKCAAVVCCRLSPKQKSLVVGLVKRQKSAPSVAAIGDGANDVAMIKEAHVGLGIMGKEGRQAVLCSDFAFAKFKFLKRALLVHGHWYYVRTSNLIQYFFYKNIVFIMPQFYFFLLSGYSTQQLYDSLFYTCYNTVLTSFPILLYGVFEQNHPEETLLNSPSLYRRNRKNALMTWRSFYLWLTFGAWHSLVVFFMPTIFYQLNSQSINGSCLQQYGTLILHNSVFVVNLKLVLHSRFWSAPFVASVALSILILFLVSIVYSSMYMQNVNDHFYWTFNNLLQSPNYWLLCVVTCVVALIPDALTYLNLSSYFLLDEAESIST